MKQFIKVSMVVVFLATGMGYCNAQSSQGKEKAQEKQEMAKERQEEAKNKNNEARGNNKNKMESRQVGNAYGKDKGMSGREFGLQRAEDARNSVQHSNVLLTETADLLSHQNDRLKALKSDLEEKRKSRTSSEAEIKELDGKITNASKKLDDLRERLRNQREKIVEIETNMVRTIDEM